MDKLRVGIIGCGRSGKRKAGEGLSHRHAKGYETSPQTTIVACADIVEEYAEAYREYHKIPKAYTDYHKMLAEEKLDIVSIITWPHLHAEMTIAAAEAGARAVHCEKPMACSYGDSKKMVRVCGAKGTQLTFGHQRRFGAPFRKAKELADGGAIGKLVALEGRCSNMYDWGTHWFDMMFFYNNQQPVEWVLGQIDMRDGKEFFGVRVEGHGMGHWRYANGVFGHMFTGASAGSGAHNVLRGTEGVIEVGVQDGPTLRMMNAESGGWKDLGDEEGLHGGDAFTAAVHDAVDSLVEGREPELSGKRALQATEMIFATYHSSRLGKRIDLPLNEEDLPLNKLLPEPSVE